MIDGLDGPQLLAATEFIAFVKDRSADSPTAELLALPGFDKSLARGLADIKAGRTKPWREVRDDL